MSRAWNHPEELADYCVSIGEADMGEEILKLALPKWQPIETAPKDGTPILLGLPVCGNLWAEDRRVYEGRWHEREGTWASINGFILFSVATHWMPLPEPPEK
jgi:hypothetical protein